MLAARQGVARGVIAARRSAVATASTSASSSSKLRAPAGFVIVSRAKSTAAATATTTTNQGGVGAERKSADESAVRKGSTKTAAVKSPPVGKASAPSVAVTASATRSRKLTPAAKAKAQASASRALREQLSAVRGAGGATSASPQLVQQEIEEVLAARAQRAAVADGDDAREGGGDGLGRGGNSEQEQQLRMLASALELSHTLVDPLTPAEAVAATSASGIANKQTSSASSNGFQYQHRLRDVVAYATAEGYDFEALIASGRLPDGWQLLEDDEVLYIPSWPRSQANKVTSSSSSSAASSQQSPHHSQVPWVGGDAFLFRSGSYVTWGMTEEQSRRFLRAVIRTRASASGATQRAMSLAAAVGKGRRNSNSSSIRGPSEIEIGPYDEIGDEAMEYLVAEDQITRVVGDVIVMGQAPTLDPKEDFTSGNDDIGAGDSAANNIGNATDNVNERDPSNGQEDEPPSWTPLLARLAFSQGLARSARLSVQESALSSYLEEVASVPGRLEAAGKVPMHRREVIRKMGTLLRLRQRANLDTENFLDDPEVSKYSFLHVQESSRLIRRAIL